MSMTLRRATGAALACLAGLALAPAAQATWSIILIDTRTGEIAVGSATCLTGFDLKVGTPILITGVGAGTAQSFVDSTGQNRIVVRDQLLLGTDPNQILNILSAFDTGHQTRQYGLVDVQGRAATFSGTGAGAWAGGTIGQTGDIAYAIQGNVLSGACVVEAAVQAVINTPGDLAAKLMASMEASRITGGDGRCSCSNGNPPGCGCPPSVFVKSSHIAYMLIARTGDRDGANGLHRVGNTPRTIKPADLNADGLIDLVTANQNGGNLSTLINITPESVNGYASPYAVFAPAINSPASTGVRGLDLADLNGDGLLDAAVTFPATNLLGIMTGKPGGQFDAPVTVPSFASSPIAVAAADFDGVNGPDVAVLGQNNASVAIRLNLGDGTFGPASVFPVGGTSPNAFTIADLNSDGKPDIAVAVANPPQITTLINDGNGTLAPGAITPLPGATPNDITAADLDNDGDIDLAVARTTIATLLRQPDGTYAVATYPTATSSTLVNAGDLDNDGDIDLIGIGGGSNTKLRNIGAGTFAPGPIAQSISGYQDSILADLDGDADLDLAAAMGGTSAMVVQNNLTPYGLAAFNSGQGAATGDYFMSFNIANQNGNNPDPVFQLKALFDTWRNDLKGRPDAVRSLVSVKPGTIPPTPGTPVQVLVELLDWQGLISTVPSIALEAEYEPTSAGATTIQSITTQGGNVFVINLLTTGTQGVDRLRITADDGIRPVVLMPSPEILVGSACKADCDASGTVDINDFVCFQTFFSLGDPQADCDGSGTLNIDDFVCFQTAFSLGC
jgi:Family of unknown function (DUF1028)/FG-GAP-like repeat